MLKHANSSTRVDRRFLLALGLSVLLHLGALSRPGVFSIATEAAGNQSLQVSLLAPKATRSVASPLQIATVPDVSAPEVKTPRKVEKPVTKPAGPAGRAEPKAVVSTAPAPPPTPTKEPGGTAQTSGFSLPGLIGPVQRVEIGFEIFSGADRQLIGRGQHLYFADNGEHYGLSIKQTFNSDEPSRGEPWQLEISGTVTRQGLSPTLFQMQGAVSERLMALKELPGASSLPSAKVRSGRIPDGILDRQSLLYQFMQQPPALTGGKLWLTDGVTHRLYTYHLAGAESFTIQPLGGVRAIKLVLSNPDSAESIELWLVPDLHYLPAKLRYTDRNGVITEQLVNSLEFK